MLAWTANDDLGYNIYSHWLCLFDLRCSNLKHLGGDWFFGRSCQSQYRPIALGPSKTHWSGWYNAPL